MIKETVKSIGINRFPLPFVSFGVRAATDIRKQFMANGFEIYQQRKKPETLVTQLKRFRGEYFDKCRLLSKRTAFSWALPYEYEIFISWSLWMTFCGSLHARLSSRYSSLPIQHSSSRRPSIHSSWKYSFRNTVCSHKECRLSSAHVKLLKHNDIRKVNAEKI